MQQKERNNRKRILAQRTDGLGHGVGIAILVEAFGEGMLLRRRSGRSDGVGGLALGLALEEGEERHFGLSEEEKVMDWMAGLQFAGCCFALAGARGPRG